MLVSMESVVYDVPGVHCPHCEAAIAREVGVLPGVDSVEVDLERKQVTVIGTELDDATLRAAIDEAGYDVL
jgi:copper chaperone CopZ